MRGANLIKLFKILELFSKPGGTTLKEISETLDIDRRSVYRWIDIVEELGFPIYDDKLPLEKKKRWKLEEAYWKKFKAIQSPVMNITFSEVISLYLLKGEEKIYRGTEIEKTINSAFNKIGTLVPANLLKQFSKIKTLFIASSKFAKDYSGKEDMIDSLTDAMLKQKTCYVKYHSFYDDKIKNFKIDPLHFFEHKGGLYVFVNTTRFKEIRKLAVERIEDLKITDSSFRYPEKFNPEERLNAAFDIVYDKPIQVKVWFSADQARYIRERKWAVDQKITNKRDGSIVLELNTSGWDDVKRWVLSYGSEAKVLKPSKLRKEIIAELNACRKIYKK